MNPYTGFLARVAADRPTGRYTVFVYGTALWGHCTTLRDGTPVSDIDLVVVGRTLDDLRLAAARIADLFLPFRRADAPFFKVGLKLRLQPELGESQLNANEAAALLRGKHLAGELLPTPANPSFDWYRRQVHLVVPTRRQCNVTQRLLLTYAPDPVPLQRYLAARTLLDIPAVLMSDVQDLGGPYPDRVSCFSEKLAALHIPESDKRELELRLRDAVRTKLEPDSYDCGTIEDAEALLVSFATRCGVDTDRGAGISFWQSHRPLDVRDWILRQGAA